jgi:ABC-2 type transport system permease protein
VNLLKSKLEFLTKMSLNRKIKTKWFLIANIILALIIMAVVNIDHIIELFGGDFNEPIKIYVIDNTEDSFDLFKSSIESYSSSIYKDNNYKVEEYDKTLDEAKEEMKDDDKIYAIVFDSSLDNTLKATIVSNAYIDTIDYQMISQAINNTKITIALANSNLTEEEWIKINSDVEIERIILDEEKDSEDESMDTIMSTVFPIVILPFFMLTIFLVQMIGAEINDEKTTRGMEIIISNVSPKTHFFSKVLAGNIFVILQGALLIIYFALGVLIRYIIGGMTLGGGLTTKITSMVTSTSSDFISKLVIYIPFILILMLITFLAYSLLAGILASMTTNAEDFNQLQTPIMVISLIGYYLAMMAGVFKGALFIRILSYVPFISAILAPSLLVLGQIGITDIIISIILTILTNYLLIKYGLKIYKVGILNYSSKDLWKKMFKAMKD